VGSQPESQRIGIKRKTGNQKPCWKKGPPEEELTRWLLGEKWAGIWPDSLGEGGGCSSKPINRGSAARQCLLFGIREAGTVEAKPFAAEKRRKCCPADAQTPVSNFGHSVQFCQLLVSFICLARVVISGKVDRQSGKRCQFKE
jgi:hypothetical protein